MRNQPQCYRCYTSILCNRMMSQTIEKLAKMFWFLNNCLPFFVVVTILFANQFRTIITSELNGARTKWNWSYFEKSFSTNKKCQKHKRRRERIKIKPPRIHDTEMAQKPRNCIIFGFGFVLWFNLHCIKSRFSWSRVSLDQLWFLCCCSPFR